MNMQLLFMGNVQEWQQLRGTSAYEFQEAKRIENNDWGQHCQTYSESDKVLFPVLSSSEAASNGMWSIFGPARQYLVSDEFANELKDALKNARKLELIKDRGAYWLPIGPTQSDEQTREDANHF